MGFISRILDSIPEEQKSGLEKPMAEFIKGLGGSAGAMEAIQAAGASMGNHGITMASEGASNAAAPASMTKGPRGIE